jgi:hypothetical protein
MPWLAVLGVEACGASRAHVGCFDEGASVVCSWPSATRPESRPWSVDRPQPQEPLRRWHPSGFRPGACARLMGEPGESDNGVSDQRQ